MGSNKKHKIKKYQECDDYEDDDDDDESDENDDVDKNRMIYGKNRLRKNFFFSFWSVSLIVWSPKQDNESEESEKNRTNYLLFRNKKNNLREIDETQSVAGDNHHNRTSQHNVHLNV